MMSRPITPGLQMPDLPMFEFGTDVLTGYQSWRTNDREQMVGEQLANESATDGFEKP